MSDILALAVGFNQFGIPLMGLVALFASKLCRGRRAEIADRWLLSIFALVIVMTFHALLLENRYWLLHSMTLGIMVVGATWEPRCRDDSLEMFD